MLDSNASIKYNVGLLRIQGFLKGREFLARLSNHRDLKKTLHTSVWQWSSYLNFLYSFFHHIYVFTWNLACLIKLQPVLHLLPQFLTKHICQLICKTRCVETEHSGAHSYFFLQLLFKNLFSLVIQWYLGHWVTLLTNFLANEDFFCCFSDSANECFSGCAR